jgi:hypothetical protein
VRSATIYLKRCTQIKSNGIQSSSSATLFQSPMPATIPFLAWHIPPELTEVDRDLPFHGPFDTSFCVKSVWKLRGCPGWSVIATEMQSAFGVGNASGKM